jgi:hypothetical protein
MIHWYTHKTSGLKTSCFKTSEMSGLQNIRFKKRLVYKTSSFETSTPLNITKCSFSKKFIDLTYVMLGKVGSIAIFFNVSHNITICWVRFGQ